MTALGPQPVALFPDDDTPEPGRFERALAWIGAEPSIVLNLSMIAGTLVPAAVVALLNNDTVVAIAAIAVIVVARGLAGEAMLAAKRAATRHVVQVTKQTYADAYTRGVSSGERSAANRAEIAALTERPRQ